MCLYTGTSLVYNGIYPNIKQTKDMTMLTAGYTPIVIAESLQMCSNHYNTLHRFDHVKFISAIYLYFLS